MVDNVPVPVVARAKIFLVALIFDRRLGSTD